MNPATAALVTSSIAQGIVSLVEAFRIHTGKPEGWKPSTADFLDLEEWAAKTPEDIKREARERLGIPVEQDTPQAPV
jgi:hypothetical protein